MNYAQISSSIAETIGAATRNLSNAQMTALAGALSVWLDKAAKDEREMCAKMLELRNSELLLMVGEMTAQELRTVKAVLAERAYAIRNRPKIKFSGTPLAAAQLERLVRGKVSIHDTAKGKSMKWQPIETAPKDTFHVLLFGDGPGFEQCSFVGYWYEHDAVWLGFDHKPAGHPTHWMPLPEAPNKL